MGAGLDQLEHAWDILLIEALRARLRAQVPRLTVERCMASDIEAATAGVAVGTTTTQRRA